MSIGNYLTVDEAAAKIKVTGGRIYQYITDGRFKTIRKIGKSILLDKEEVDKFAKIPRVLGRPKKSAKKR